VRIGEYRLSTLEPVLAAEKTKAKCDLLGVQSAILTRPLKHVGIHGFFRWSFLGVDIEFAGPGTELNEFDLVID
jgi:hypothetical protein